MVRQAGTVAFCEVKARSADRFGLPAEAVTAAKQARIRRLAARWLREWAAAGRQRPRTLRFDVATVLGDEFQMIEGAF